MDALKKISQNFYWFPSILMIIGGITKLSGNDELANSLAKLGLQDKMELLGILELSCVAIFISPRTMPIGFFLLCSYWGGAIAADLTGGIFNATPLLMLSLFWIAIYLKTPTIFLNPLSDERKKVNNT